MTRSPEWKTRFQEVFHICQEELKKTTEIGKKMLSASKTNSNLHESYEELGAMVVKALREGKLSWENDRVKEIIKNIETCEKDLEAIEKQVNELRFSENDEAQSERERDIDKK